MGVVDELWKDALSAIVGTGVGGLAMWIVAALHYGKKLEALRTSILATVEVVEGRAIRAASQAKLEAVTELTRAHGALTEDLARLERDLDQLQVTNVDGREKSAAERASAALWAKRLEEVADQCSETTATLNRILGALQVKGFVVHE